MPWTGFSENGTRYILINGNTGQVNKEAIKFKQG